MKGRGKVRPVPKGRQVDPQAEQEIRSLLDEARSRTGTEPRRADLLIENLHLLQDRFGHLSAAHLAALAKEMRLA
ncbi:MAG: hypothetical protein JO035_00585, partial [Betaproteobacteria bacterium]|nr:hypothetical protein [Betaproteobacteria bacterium]